ncbi:MAG TPA: ATP-binding protein [Candidatus Acidoferrales bacterium]|nr:ATP-binding protein [Candidatus Acidoferrales bacterium]
MSAPRPDDAGVRTVTLRIDSRLDQVELLGRAVAGLAGAAGLPRRACGHVELAIVEAVNNAIRHAYRGQPGHVVEVVFARTEDGIVLQVCDEGSPMPARQAPVLDFDPADVPNLPEGGMGLFLIHNVMDRVDYASENGRNVLTLSRRIAA